MGGNKVRINITISEELNKVLDEVAGKLGVSKSELIEYATRFLMNVEKQVELKEIIREICRYIAKTLIEKELWRIDWKVELPVECHSNDVFDCRYILAHYGGNESSAMYLEYVYKLPSSYTPHTSTHEIFEYGYKVKQLVDIRIIEYDNIRVYRELSLKHVKILLQLMSKIFE